MPVPRSATETLVDGFLTAASLGSASNQQRGHYLLDASSTAGSCWRTRLNGPAAAAIPMLREAGIAFSLPTSSQQLGPSASRQVSVRLTPEIAWAT